MEPLKELKTNEDYIQNELLYGAHNYKPIPVVIERGKGIYLYDVEGNRYYDFISSYGAVNQGHCNENILNALINQSKKLTICSRAFFNNQLGLFERYLSNLFGYDKALLMNSGAEASETAYKICRKWGYEVKKIPENSAKIIVCNNNFSGRTIACISASTNKVCTNNFGPFLSNFVKIPFNNLEELEKELKDPNVCSFFVEPIQGEAGVIIPSENYLKCARDLCKKYNVLYVNDEIQTGLGRTGKLLCSENYDAKPDMVLLGKALSGGFYPVSAVLANNEVMLVLKPGEHGSTYGGNPLACAVSRAAIDFIIKDNLCEKSQKLGKFFLDSLKRELKECKLVFDIRGKGLFCAIEFVKDLIDAWQICLKLKENGILTKNVHARTIRLSPPLCITEEQLAESAIIIANSIKYFENKQ